MYEELTLGELISRGEETSKLDSSSGMPNVFSPLCLAKITTVHASYEESKSISQLNGKLAAINLNSIQIFI